MKSEFLFFVDFGLEHVSLLVCKINNNRVIDIPLFLKETIEITSQRPQNIFGQIDNFEALLKIINDAEKQLKTTINEIILTSKNSAFNLYFSSCKLEFKKPQKILQIHREKLATKIIKYFYEKTHNSNVLLDFITNNTILDDTITTANPYKMSCRKIVLNATIISIKKLFINTLSSYLEKYKIHIKHYITPCVSVYSLLKNNLSKNENYLFIDIGSCSTEYCVIQNGSIIYMDNIFIGGLDITRDIASEISLYIRDADKAKKKICDVNISNTNNKTTKFAIEQVEKISDARFSEIITSIYRKLQEQKLINKNSFKKIYIFGGTSMYKNAVQIINDTFKIETEIISNKYILNSDLLYNKVKEEFMTQENIQLFGAVNFYMSNIETYQNAKKGFLFKIPSKISCLLKDLLY